ncbi:MAG: hypothetical protein K2N74_02165 [Clostridiales bacterium]|nr:hypothetical protein [Clostridiales bacterium]
MKDALYEESAKSQKSASEAKLYTIFHVLSIVFLVAIVIQVVVFVAMELPRYIYFRDDAGNRMSGTDIIFSLITWVILLAILVLGWFIGFKMKRRFNVSYDYLFVEDELRITKVFNDKKRKYLRTLEADHILKIGYCDKESYERTVSGLQGKKPQKLTPNQTPSEDKIFIYVLYSSTIEKNVYVIECRQMMLEYLVRAAGRNKFERE